MSDRTKKMAKHMTGMIFLTMTDFSFAEGYAMFQSIADILKHIEETNGDLPDDFDAALLEAKLHAYLGDKSRNST